MRKLFFLTLLTTLVAFVLVASAGANNGGTTGGKGGDPSLSPFKSLTLPGAFGNVQAVLYDGNEALGFSTSTTTITGFTVPAAPFDARTTYTVVDGQCQVPEPPQPENCGGGSGSLPGGTNGDTAAFTGGAGTLTFGPDAFRGNDHCSYSPASDTCLWDTKNEDVTKALNPGDTSAVVDVTSGLDPLGVSADCINHEAQTFAVGSDLAWLNAGYTAAGAGLRNQASNTIAITGVPPGSQVIEADLYWNILNPSQPSDSMQLNGFQVASKMYAKGGDPCWDSGSWAFRADVTTLVPGNGVYKLSGYPTSNTSGLNPWVTVGTPPPLAEGASLIVFYGLPSTPGKVTGGGYIDPVTGELTDPATVDIQSGVGVGDKATFGFNVQFAAGDAMPSGQLRYIDHGAVSEDIKATEMDALVIGTGPCGPNTHADIYFMATENGTPNQPFKVGVDDCAEPGSQTSTSNMGPDMFSIQKVPAGYSAAGPLVGGNIQIHKS